MREWMITLLDLSLAASLAVLAVLLLRLVIRPLSKKYFYWLWSAVFLRAVCPFSYSSPFSFFRLFSFMRTEGGQLTVSLEPYQAVRLSGILGLGDGAFQAGAASAPQAGVDANIFASQAAAGGRMIFTALAVIWTAGVVALLLWGVFSWLRIRRRAALAVRTEEGVYETDQISTAFVLGFFRPRIYLPAGIRGQEREFVLLHERIHLRRHDHQYKMLAWLVVVLHWFNPVLWLSFVLLTRDMEMSCDERVLEEAGEGQKENYGEFLLSLAAPSGFPAGSPLAFGESSVKARIRNILRYKKRGKAAVIAAAVLVALGIWLCLSNPSGQEAVSVIGGAEGPTDIWVTEEPAQPEAGTFASDAEGFLTAWAQAAGSRDADAVYETLSPELRARAEEFGIEWGQDENGEEVLTMGWSSPFLVLDPVIEILPDSPEGVLEAEITYPSITSNPLWWVWKDYLTLEPAGDAYQVTDWEQRMFFEPITSYADFAEAYESWMPDYFDASVVDRSFAEILVQHDLAGTNPEYYGTAFSNPSAGLEETLHLGGGESQTQMEGEGEALVTYRFQDGEIQARMVQPGLSEGSQIWVPKEVIWADAE